MKKVWLALVLTTVMPAGLAPAGPSPSVAANVVTFLGGYAVVTPVTGTATDLLVTQIFGFTQGFVSSQTEAAAPQLTTSALLFVNFSQRLGRDVGLAIVNPGNTEARMTMTLRRDDGIMVGAPLTVFVPPRSQVAQFVTQFFSSQLGLPAEFTGTLSMISNSPVAMYASRFRGSSFATETLMQLSEPSPLPQIVPGVGGTGGVLLADFVQGDGWSTQFILVNKGLSDMTVRLDLFTPKGDPMTVTLNGASGTTFPNLRIRAGGVLVVAPLDIKGDSPF